MAYRTLITATELLARHGDPVWAVVDCRFSLGDPESGRRAYARGHVPGAAYAHLDEDLSAPVVPGRTGRHPLPEVDRLVSKLSAWGVGPGVQVVAYDDAGGAMAARLWWLVGWLGHDDVAVLDGGWPAWIAAGGPVESGPPGARPPGTFVPRIRPERVVSAGEVAAGLAGSGGWTLADARAPERYRGEVEPLDPVAGHIPGALSVPFGRNLGPDGLFRQPEDLRARFQEVLAGADPGSIVHYCGSGVTAAHNVLAMAHAGLGTTRLYPGSWSEWVTDPDRPVETG